MTDQLLEIPIRSAFYGHIMCFEQDQGISQHLVRNEDTIWEEYNVEVFRQHLQPGDIVVDVGAYIGLHTIALSKCVGPTGKVVAFEGQRRFFNVMAKNTCGYANVDAILAAVGSPEQSGQYTGANSVELSNPGGTQISISDCSDTAVKYVCLDDYCDVFKGVKLIKIDVEGNELQVIKGARRVLTENNPFIVMEICGGYVPHTDPWKMTELSDTDRQIMTVIQYMKGLGYVVLERVTHDYYFQKKA